MNARSSVLLALVALSSACMVPPASQPMEPPPPATATSVTSAPTTAVHEPSSPPPNAPSAAPSGTPDGALPASALKIGGVSLSDAVPEQVVGLFKKLGYQARPSHPGAFSGVPVWDDRFSVLSFELSKSGAVIGTVEIVRPVKGRKPGARKAGDFIKDAFDEGAGLVDGNGFLDTPSDTAITAVVQKSEGGTALSFLMKVMKQK